jgi:aspartokinase
MQSTPGILAMIANELAINTINIVEVMTCPPEMLFFVKKEDFQKASNVIHQLCQTR